MLKVLLQSKPWYIHISRLQRLFSIASGMGVGAREEGFYLKEDSQKICACFGDGELTFGATREDVEMGRWPTETLDISCLL